MGDTQLLDLGRQWANDILVWIGFGTLVGLAAKAVMPGRDPGGAIATLLTGIAGSVIGCGVLAFFWRGDSVTPLSLAGFLVATGGAFVLLFFYRLLAGRVIREGTAPLRPYRRRGAQVTVVQGQQGY